jgi:hypothetical protein
MARFVMRPTSAVTAVSVSVAGLLVVEPEEFVISTV